MSSCEHVFIHGEECVKHLHELRLRICLDENGSVVQDIPDKDELLERLIYMCYEMDPVFFKQKYNEMIDYMED